MAEYERSRSIMAPEADVFAYVADPRNFPTFLPTVQAAQKEGEERVRVRGEARGAAYEDDGWYNADWDRRRMEWRADDDTYSGWLTVNGTDDGRTQVFVHLSVAPFVTASGRPITGEPPGGPDAFEQGLEAALDSLRNILEGRGGKEAPGQAG